MDVWAFLVGTQQSRRRTHGTGEPPLRRLTPTPKTAVNTGNALTGAGSHVHS